MDLIYTLIYGVIRIIFQLITLINKNLLLIDHLSILLLIDLSIFILNRSSIN